MKEVLYDLSYNGKKYNIYNKIKNINLVVSGYNNITLGILLQHAPIFENIEESYFRNVRDENKKNYDNYNYENIIVDELYVPSHLFSFDISNTILSNRNIITNSSNNNIFTDNEYLDLYNTDNITIKPTHNLFANIVVPDKVIPCTDVYIDDVVKDKANVTKDKVDVAKDIHETPINGSNDRYDVVLNNSNISANNMFEQIVIKNKTNNVAIYIETNINNDINDFIKKRKIDDYKHTKRITINKTDFKTNIKNYNYLYKFNNIIKHISKKLFKSIKKNNPAKYIYYSTQIKEISSLPGCTLFAFYNTNPHIGVYKVNLLALLVKGNILDIILFFYDYKKLIKILFNHKYEFIFSIFINDIVETSYLQAKNYKDNFVSNNKVLFFLIELVSFFSFKKCNYIYYALYPDNISKYNDIILSYVDDYTHGDQSNMLFFNKNYFSATLATNILLTHCDNRIKISSLMHSKMLLLEPLYNSIISENIVIFDKNLKQLYNVFGPDVINYAIINIILFKKESLIDSVHKIIIATNDDHKKSGNKQKNISLPIFLYTLPLYSIIFQIFINIVGYKTSLLPEIFKKTYWSYLIKQFIKVSGNILHMKSSIANFIKYSDENIYDFRYSKNDVYLHCGTELINDCFLSSTDIINKLLDNEIMLEGIHIFNKKIETINITPDDEITIPLKIGKEEYNVINTKYRILESILYYKHFTNNELIKLLTSNINDYIKKNIIEDNSDNDNIKTNITNTNKISAKKRKKIKKSDNESSDSDTYIIKQKKSKYTCDSDSDNDNNKIKHKPQNKNNYSSDSSDDENEFPIFKNKTDIKLENIKNNYNKLIRFFLNMMNSNNFFDTVEGTSIMNDLFNSQHL